MKVRDTVSGEGVCREILFDSEDVQFIVEGYEFAEDEMKEVECEEEFEGEYFYDAYNNFRDAIEKYLELLEDKWEVVRFYIRLKSSKIPEEIGVNLLFNVSEYSITLDILINSTKLCESYAKKLAKIQEIIESGKV